MDTRHSEANDPNSTGATETKSRRQLAFGVEYVERTGGIMSRWNVNISPTERGARILIGLIGAIGGALLLVGVGSAVAVVLELLLVLAGLNLIITGATGHCPLCKKLGHMPASLRTTTP